MVCLVDPEIVKQASEKSYFLAFREVEIS